jgi:tetratricopeptide (TPR) repeat protein
MQSERRDRRTLEVGTTAKPSAIPFVGREREVAALLGGLQETLGGEGRLFLLSGEPGIGKSRLADELLLRARERGARILWGRCWEAGGAPAYWPWVQALRAYVRERRPDDLRAQLGAGASDIAQMLPDVRELFPDLPDPPSVDPESARFRLFDAVTYFLSTAARDQPLVLLIDDLHAADEPSLLLLQFVARELTNTSIMIVGTYRVLDASWQPSFVSSLAELTRAGATRRLDLRGLPEDDVQRVIEGVTGISPPAPLVAFIYEHTEGNPLFVAELARLLASEGRLEHVEVGRIAIPEGIREVIGRRLDRLSAGCIEVLTLASVLGREFGIETLNRVSGWSVDEVVETMEEAERARVVLDAPGSIGHLRFSHALIRDSLYDDLPAGRRIELHRATGEVLEALHGGDPESHLAELAHHFFASAPGEGSPKAVDYARRAGDRAVRLLAYEEAVRLYRMAVHAMELGEDGDGAARCDLLLALGDAQARAGDESGSQETFIRAAAISKRLGMPEQLGWAALGYGGRFVWGRASVDPQVVPLLKEALAALPDEDSALKARILARLSGALRDDHDPAPRDRLSEEAVAIARRIGDQSTLAYTLGGRWIALLDRGRANEGLEIVDELIQVAEAAGDLEQMTDGHIYRLWLLFELGNMPAVHEKLDALVRLDVELRQPARTWHRSVIQGVLALFEGHFGDAESHIEEAVRTGERVEQYQSRVSFITQTFALRKEQGRLEEVREIVERAAAQYPTRPVMRCLQASLYAEIGDRTAASLTFETFASGGFDALPHDMEWTLGMSLLTEVADVLGDTDRASTLYELLRPLDTPIVQDPNEFSMGAASRYLGLLTSLMSRWEEAVSHFENALEVNERTGARPWLAHTQHDYARMLLRRDSPGDRERAIDLLLKARETCGELGMALERKVSAVLGELGIGATTVPPAVDVARDATAHSTVFRREGDYWSIAFEGHSIRLRDTKGLQHIAQLLANPGREIHSLDLVAGAVDRTGSIPLVSLVKEDRLETRLPNGAEEILDGAAMKAYKLRIEDLREELEEAESWSDAERAARARAEMDFLARELTSAAGLGGRVRRGASPAERARQSVTKAIKATIARIAKENRSLGRHLSSTIHTGNFCRYEPDPRSPIIWIL